MSGHLDGPFDPQKKIEDALRFYADERNWLNGREIRGFPGFHGRQIAVNALAALAAVEPRVRAEERAATLREVEALREALKRIAGCADPYPAKIAREALVAHVEPGVETLRDAAERALTACLEVLPLEGAWPHYRVSENVPTTIRALPEEWAEAAWAVAGLAARFDPEAE